MKIKRNLKHGSFQWNDETKKFKITQGDYSVELGKVYAFAFLRFVFRIAQRNWFRKLTKPQVTITKGNEVTSIKGNSLDDTSTVPTGKESRVMLVQREEGMEIEQYELL